MHISSFSLPCQDNISVTTGLVSPNTRDYDHLQGLQIVLQIKDLEYIYILEAGCRKFVHR